MISNDTKVNNLDETNQLLVVRLCHLRKETKTSEYGFNLKGKSIESCHYIGKVDANTKADSAGLKSGDKILEINRINIHKLQYDEIIQLIKLGLTRRGRKHKSELLLMVIDKDIDECFKRSNMPIDNFNNNFKIVINSSCFNFKNSDENDNVDACLKIKDK